MSTTTQQFLMRHGLALLIGTLVVGLLGLIAFETQWGASLGTTTRVASGQGAKNGDTALLPAFGLPAIESGFKDTVERPLFMPSRRPVPVASGSGQPAMKKGQFKLAGTIVNQDLPYVFLVEIATGKGMRVAKGADILASGISVAEVGAVRVVLKQGDETEELSLRTASSPPPTAQPMPQPGAPGAVPTTPMPRPPPSGVGVTAMPLPQGGLPGGPVPGGAGASMPLPMQVPSSGSSVLPGFVLSPPAAVPDTAAANPADAAAASQRRRRSQNVPQQ